MPKGSAPPRRTKSPVKRSSSSASAVPAQSAATVPPVTVPPATVPPVTVPPVTVAPVTVPPVTVPPVTVPPVTNATPAAIVCPNCKSDSVRQSSDRRILDFFFKSRSEVPFRCRACRVRFYAKATLTKLPKPDAHKRPLPLLHRPRTKRFITEGSIVLICLIVFSAFLYFLSKPDS